VNDLKDLLERALADGHGPARGAHADPAGDLARGKRLRARRTRNRLIGTTAAAAVIAAAAVTVPAAFRGGPAHQPAASGTTPPVATAAGKPAGQPAVTQVKLVAYTGAQPQGYLVKAIPAGWVIQGSDNYNLVIAPAGDPDKNPDSFLGKLLVTQEEFDTAGAASTGWVAMTAGGRAAYYNDGASDAMAHTAGLVIRQASGQWLLVQAPTFLGWSQQQLAQFALGVTVTATATPGKG
jgi:hypothetical protein